MNSKEILTKARNFQILWSIHNLVKSTLHNEEDNHSGTVEATWLKRLLSMEQSLQDGKDEGNIHMCSRISLATRQGTVKY